MSDINLAGLSLISLLAMYFPTIGIFAERKRRIRTRAQHANAQITKLITEEQKRMQRNLDHHCIPDYDRGLARRDDEGHLYIACGECGAEVYCGLSIEVR
jgi:hypothetical protein